MAKKNVSFEVAKALKEAGYPQELPCALTRPTYLDAWLWLWREKKHVLHPVYYGMDTPVPFWSVYMSGCCNPKDFHELGRYTDPEEAIASAIDYLVENNLIK